MSTPLHPTFETLADLVEGCLPAGKSAPVQAHLDTCAECAADVAWLRRTVGLMRTDDTEAAPEHVLNRALRLFRQRLAPQGVPGQGEVFAGLGKRIVAVLRFEGGGRVPAFGLRAGAGAGHQLIYGAGDHEVEVRLTPGGQGWVVAGQVLGPVLSPGAGTATLEGPPGRLEVTLNDLGEFGFPPRPDGRYTLRLRLGDTAVEIEALTLPPASS